jgi:hypothetical protein
MKSRILMIGMFLLTTLFVGQAQTRKEKTEFILNKLELVKNQKKIYENRVQFLKFAITGADTITLKKLEKKITDNFIKEELCTIFDSLFTDLEVNDLYQFCHTSAIDKIFFSNVIMSRFYINSPLNKEFEDLMNRNATYE